MAQSVELGLYVLFILVILPSGFTLNIRQIIEQRSELSSLKDFTKSLDFLQEVGVDSEITYTFFASHNDAFEKLSEKKLKEYKMRSTSTKYEMENIMKFHTVSSFTGLATQTSDFGDSVLMSSAVGSPKLFLRNVEGEYYVNGARVLTADIKASNGVIHIIDSLLDNVGESDNALLFLENSGQATQMGARKFYQMLLEYKSNHHSQCRVTADRQLNLATKLTLFAPSNEAIARIPTQQFNSLLKDVTQLKQVIEGHLITEEAYHLNLLLRPGYVSDGIEAMSGRIMPKRFGGDVYVSNNCAQGKIIFANITVGNGVVHIVDGLLGFVYNDALNYFKNERDMGKIYGHIMSSPSIRDLLQVDPGNPEQIPENQRLTIFGPIDSSMSGVDLTQDSRYLDRVLRMHMLRGMLELSEIINGTQRATLREGSSAIFSRYGDDFYVEVNYVRAKITQGDICVKNGIIHKVDHVLGEPRYTADEEIQTNADFKELYRAVRETGLVQYLGDTTKKITVFAPFDQAFTEMQDTEKGRMLLDRRHTDNMKRVLNRHILPEELFLDQLPSGITERTTTLGDTIEIDKRSDGYTLRFEGQSIRVLRANMRVKNGAFHVIDTVMFSNSPRSSEWTSAAVVTRQAPLFAGLAVLLYVAVQVLL